VKAGTPDWYIEAQKPRFTLFGGAAAHAAAELSEDERALPVWNVFRPSTAWSISG
jgi:hypothetical protein